MTPGVALISSVCTFKNIVSMLQLYRLQRSGVGGEALKPLLSRDHVSTDNAHWAYGDQSQ